MTESSGDTGYPGQQQLSDATSEFNKIMFLVKQQLGFVRTATLVKVMKVSTAPDTVAEVGFVDVLPLVNMLDGRGQSSKHFTIYGVPYFRLQGGVNAIICDPEVGDIGIMVCGDRDLSSVKVNKEQANPGSLRRFDLADGLYLGGFLNAEPEQYVQFKSDGITIQDKNGNKIEMSPTGIEITGDVNVVGALTNNSVNVGSTHTHSGVQSGGSNTGPPV